MPITIEELNKKYKVEDKNWDFKLFYTWLVKKGIDAPLITATLKQVLVDYSLETLPEKHHDFDNAVLRMARISKDKYIDYIVQELETGVQKSIMEQDADWYNLSLWGKFKEAWKDRNVKP